jgi:hypothetical protein
VIRRLTSIAAAAAVLTTMATTASATETQACEMQNVTDTARTVNLVPPRVAGDADFAGHGPNVQVRVSLATLSPDGEAPTVDVHVDMMARETQSDFTTATAGVIRTIRIWHGFEGWRVDGVVGMDTLDGMSYLDTDHADDRFGPAFPNSFVSGYRFIGDTSGDEAGTETFVEVSIRPVTLRLSRGCP